MNNEFDRNKNNDTPMTDLGVISLIKINQKGHSQTRRLFNCPPEFYYFVFKKTSAGPEFIKSYGPNQKGNLEKDQEIYRVSIAGTPVRYEFQETFSMLDDTEISVDFELNIKIADEAKIARSVIQNKVDPLRFLRQDIKNLIDEEISQMEYSKVFSPKTREIKLSNREFEIMVKQHGIPEAYGITLDALRIKIVLSPDLKKKWENDIASWRETEIYQENIEKRKRELELKEEIAQLSVKESRLGIELDRDLEEIKHEHDDFKAQREIGKEDEVLERERKLRKEEEAERQTAIRDETEHLIDIRLIEQQANFDQQTSEQRQQLRLDAERKIHDRTETLESLRHQVTTDQMMKQLEHSRRKQEELEKIHQLRMQRLEEWEKLQFQQLQADTNLKIERLEDEQRLLLDTNNKKEELHHQYKLLEYKEQEAKHEISVERTRLENQEVHEERLARIELGKEIVRARLAMLDRISTGESHLTQEQTNMLIGIDPMNEKTIKREQIASFVEAIDEYLENGNDKKMVKLLDDNTLKSNQFTLNFATVHLRKRSVMKYTLR